MNKKHAHCAICGGPHLARGLCQKHYNEYRRSRQLTPIYALGDISERIAALTKRNQSTGCLEWTGNLNKAGYGRISVGNKVQLAHRASYEATHGPIEDRLLVCHRCDNPRCVEPQHLFLGSNADNMADKVAKKRHGFGEKHCAAVLTDEQVREIRADGRPQRVLAHEYGVSQSQISFIKRYEEWTSVPLSDADKVALAERLDREARGQRYPHSKLTPDDVRAIRADARRQKDIAAQYGVRQNVISGIKTGKIWRHVI